MDDHLEDEKTGFSVTLENHDGSLELSNSAYPWEVENAANLPLQSKQELSFSDSLESERPRRTGNYNLRKSMAWDSLFFTSKGFLDPENDDFELYDTENPLELEYSAGIFGQSEYIPSDSLEPKIPSSSGEFNLRQSIAWDSAFFTSEGVLDPEELFMINKGLMKAKTHLLPGIKELQGSTESTSTRDSDEFSLESLESDLFEDIRASIHKSTSKKLDASFHTEIKTTGRRTVDVNGLERTANKTSVQTRAQATRSREPIPLPLKPKKMLVQSNSIAATATPNGAEAENKSGKTPLGKHSGMSQKSCLFNSHDTSSTPSPRSSSGSATATNISTVTCSAYDRSDSASSDATGKSPSNSLRRKSDSPSTNLTSASTPKMPLRYSTKTKNDVRNSGHSSIRISGSVSAQKPSPCTSTTSSFDGWSTESSSSTVCQRSNGSKASLDGTPCKGLSFDNDSIQASTIEGHQKKQFSVESQSLRTRLPNHCIKKCAIVDGPVSSNGSGNSKASSLRMPSPKIGFFDVDKSMPTGLNGNLQFHSGAQSTLAKSKARISNLGGASNRARGGKLQLSRTSLGSQNVKQVSHQTEGLGASPAHPVQLEDASKKDSSLSRTTRIHLGMTVKNQKASSAKVGGRVNCSRTPEVGSSSSKGAQAVLQDKIRKESMGRVHVKPSKALSEGGRSVNLQRKGHVEVRCHQDNQPPPRMNEKGNKFEDQVDDLSRQLSVIDLTKDRVIEPKGNNNTSCSSLTVNNSGDC